MCGKSKIQKNMHTINVWTLCFHEQFFSSSFSETLCNRYDSHAFLKWCIFFSSSNVRNQYEWVCSMQTIIIIRNREIDEQRCDSTHRIIYFLNNFFCWFVCLIVWLVCWPIQLLFNLCEPIKFNLKIFAKLYVFEWVDCARPAKCTGDHRSTQ